jgi:hypothetical protein
MINLRGRGPLLPRRHEHGWEFSSHKLSEDVGFLGIRVRDHLRVGTGLMGPW